MSDGKIFYKILVILLSIFYILKYLFLSFKNKI